MNDSKQTYLREEYSGRWISEDGIVEQWLFPDGTFTESSNGTPGASGRWAVEGAFIFYWDDENYTADGTLFGDFIDRYAYVLRRTDNIGERSAVSRE